jgi:acyl carrier protein
MQSQSVRALIANHLAVDVERVSDDASFADDLGADSLDLVELAMRFEEHLNIAIADDESESCATVGQALELLRAKVAV